MCVLERVSINVIFKVVPSVGPFSDHLLWPIFLYTMYIDTKLKIGFYYEHYILHCLVQTVK